MSSGSLQLVIAMGFRLDLIVHGKGDPITIFSSEVAQIDVCNMNIEAEKKRLKTNIHSSDSSPHM